MNMNKQILLIIVLTVFFGIDLSLASKRSWEIKGIPVTGPNDICGKAAWIMPPPFPPNLSFTTLGAYNNDEFAIDALPLNSEICKNRETVLATHTDQLLNQLAGYTDADTRLKNVPLHQVQIKASPTGVRTVLPMMGETVGNPFPPVRIAIKPIKIKDWFNAKGRMNINCYEDGSAQIKAKFSNLMPNGVYSLIGTWKTIPPGETQPIFAALALGGSPAIVIADEKGRSRITRHLNFCPKDPTLDGSILMFIDLGYHMDGAPNGVLPSLFDQIDFFTSIDNEVFPSTKPPGIVTSPAVGFPINVEIQ